MLRRVRFNPHLTADADRAGTSNDGGGTGADDGDDNGVEDDGQPANEIGRAHV